MTSFLKLGTASWIEGASERRAVVAPLPSDSSRLVDLNRVERVRLAKLGEGHAESLADTLVPVSLRQILEGGTRAIQRVRQTLAYAEKWSRRGDLPESLARPREAVCLLPCLPRPLILRKADGLHLDRLSVQGSGCICHTCPQPSLAAIGIHRGGEMTGWCLALENVHGAILGAWMVFDFPTEGTIELRCGTHHRRIPMDTWMDLELPKLRAGEVMILPPPKIRPIPELTPGSAFRIASPFDLLELEAGMRMADFTVQ